MPEARNIVVLGASYAGLGATHYFLKHVRPHLPNDDKIKYKAVLVDPSERWYCRIAAPRTVASEALIPDEKMFLDTKSGFKEYGDVFVFVHGAAKSWDIERRTVTVTKANGSTEYLEYHALILATGTRSGSPLFSLQGNSHQEVKASLQEVRAQLENAKRVVIGGGGPTGVEVAGEIGELINGRPGWFASRPARVKTEITVVTSGSELLPDLRPALGRLAERYLNQVGADVRYNTKVSSSQKTRDGQTKVVLHDGEEIMANVYIPAMGYVPMTDYVPRHLLTPDGYVKMNENTLRVDAAGLRVYAVGDVGSYSENRIIDILWGLPVLETNLKRDLLAAHDDPSCRPTGADRMFESHTKETQLVTVGQSKGVGAMFGWKVPNSVVWMLKGRDLFSARAPDTLIGKDWLREVEWKH